ncbi:MAG: thiamine pyrophosphate-binding protein [Chloroflexi bacterium]|nr:thiamine pyrophosphate-binding protein [Chloroflexota bacterium]
MPRITSQDFLAQTIKGYGVTHVFNVPAILLEALAAMEDMDITRVTTHSELSAAYMADGYARASHRPAVCLAQAVGAANLAAGLRDAFLACSPVVAITGGDAPGSRYRYLYQQIDDFQMYDCVTKFNARVETPGRLPDLLRQAFRVATTGTPGPVHLEVPGRLGQYCLGEIDADLIVEQQYTKYPPYRPEPDPASIGEAVKALAAAERPVIIAGGGVTISGAGPELVQLAEKLSIPVATSLNGKEAILDDHPLCVGLMGTYGRSCANQVVSEADLVFFAGSRAGDLVTDMWKVPTPGTPAIQLDLAPEEIGRNYPAKVGILGDARVALQRMLDIAGPGSANRARAAWTARAQTLVQEWKAEMAPLMNSNETPIRPERICKELSECLSRDALVVADTGFSAIWTGTLLRLTSPGQSYIRCAGTLGWAFPASLGAKCALPDRPVVCFTGDGGMYYHLSELETAARLGINAVVLVNNNASLRQVKDALDAAYGGAPGGRARDLWAFRETNFAAVAESMGCLGIRVERPEEIHPALERAFAANRPVVVDVASDIDAQPAPPWR